MKFEIVQTASATQDPTLGSRTITATFGNPVGQGNALVAMGVYYLTGDGNYSVAFSSTHGDTLTRANGSGGVSTVGGYTMHVNAGYCAAAVGGSSTDVTMTTGPMTGTAQPYPNGLFLYEIAGNYVGQPMAGVLSSAWPGYTTYGVSASASSGDRVWGTGMTTLNDRSFLIAGAISIANNIIQAPSAGYTSAGFQNVALPGITGGYYFDEWKYDSTAGSGKGFSFNFKSTFTYYGTIYAGLGGIAVPHNRMKVSTEGFFGA